MEMYQVEQAYRRENAAGTVSYPVSDYLRVNDFNRDLTSAVQGRKIIEVDFRNVVSYVKFDLYEDATSYFPVADENMELGRLRNAFELVFNGQAQTGIFTEILDSINLPSKSSDFFNRVISWAISLDAVTLARKLADEGTRLHPDDERLRKTVELLAPPRVLAIGLPPKPGLAASMEWFERNAQNYRGLWVAVISGELIATARSRMELMEKIGEHNSETDLLVARVP